MRVVFRAALVLLLGLAVVGCKKRFDGPTIDACNGKLVQDGKPVSFPEGEQVLLQVFHEKGQSFGIPIQPDGSFKIGWMPVGKYSAMLTRQGKVLKGSPQNRYSVPGGLTIQDGKLEYTIDLGKGWKP
jgi:hypothetical protein